MTAQRLVFSFVVVVALCASTVEAIECYVGTQPYPNSNVTVLQKENGCNLCQFSVQGNISTFACVQKSVDDHIPDNACMAAAAWGYDIFYYCTKDLCNTPCTPPPTPGNLTCFTGKQQYPNNGTVGLQTTDKCVYCLYYLQNNVENFECSATDAAHVPLNQCVDAEYHNMSAVMYCDKNNCNTPCTPRPSNLTCYVGVQTKETLNLTTLGQQKNCAYCSYMAFASNSTVEFAGYEFNVDPDNIVVNECGKATDYDIEAAIFCDTGNLCNTPCTPSSGSIPVIGGLLFFLVLATTIFN